MFLERNIVTRQLNRCSNGNATMLSVCIVEPHVNVYKIKMPYDDNNKIYLYLQVKFAIYLFNFNQI